MSVLVKGMEMPKNCNVCNFHMLRFCCAADKDLAEKDTRPLIERRPESCPLVPVPEHGRLIDADKLHEATYHRAFETDDDTMWQSGCWVRYRAIEQVQDNQPTVIPAD